MNYFSLYRRYRPLIFDDIIGQKMIINILKSAIVNDKINHAYLFSGQHGTGKTSTARVLSKAINCTALVNGNPCLSCDHCKEFDLGSADFIELDAASNNSVEQMRDLINQAVYIPLQFKYKIYIIDEVHMLSNSAFNAMLKILEEPPKYLIFILATTEPEKIPLTVISRCQQFSFRNVNEESMSQLLRKICDSEKLNIDNYIISKIISLAGGSVRDALSILDQLAIYSKDNKIDIKLLEVIFGLVSKDEIIMFLKALIDKDLTNLLNIYYTFKEKNINFIYFSYDFANLLSDILQYNQKDNYLRHFTIEEIRPFLNVNNKLSLQAHQVYIKLIQKLQSFLYSVRGYNDASLLFKLLIFDLISHDFIKNFQQSKVSVSVDDKTLSADSTNNNLNLSVQNEPPKIEDFINNESKKTISDVKIKEVDEFASVSLDHDVVIDKFITNESFGQPADSVTKDFEMSVPSLDDEKTIVEQSSVDLELSPTNNNNNLLSDEINFVKKEDEILTNTTQSSIFKISADIKEVKTKEIYLPDDKDLESKLNLSKLAMPTYSVPEIFTIFQQKNNAVKKEIKDIINSLSDIEDASTNYNLIIQALCNGEITTTSSTEVIITFDEHSVDDAKVLNHFARNEEFYNFQKQYFKKMYNFYVLDFANYQDLVQEFRKRLQSNKLPNQVQFKSFFDKMLNNDTTQTSTEELLRIIKYNDKE